MSRKELVARIKLAINQSSPEERQYILDELMKRVKDPDLTAVAGECGLIATDVGYEEIRRDK